MEAAGDRAAAAPAYRFEKFRRLELNAAAIDDLVEVKKFREGAPETVPHAHRDRFDLGWRLFRKGERKILQSALVAVKTRGDEPPTGSRPS